jgi:hypothetical protein
MITAINLHVHHSSCCNHNINNTGYGFTRKKNVEIGLTVVNVGLHSAYSQRLIRHFVDKKKYSRNEKLG